MVRELPLPPSYSVHQKLKLTPNPTPKTGSPTSAPILEIGTSRYIDNPFTGGISISNFGLIAMPSKSKPSSYRGKPTSTSVYKKLCPKNGVISSLCAKSLSFGSSRIFYIFNFFICRYITQSWHYVQCQYG